jgi:hypothetical protein
MDGKKEVFRVCDLCASDDYVVVHKNVSQKEGVKLVDKYSAVKSVLCTD